MRELWPYVVPFPLDLEARRAVWSILSSHVGMAILRSLRLGRKNYQKDLLAELPFSNKSVITYLKKMVKAGILREGEDRVRVRLGRVIRVKWYVLTEFGKWLVLFLKDPEQVSREEAEEAIRELLRTYVSRVYEVSEFPALGQKYAVSGVPKTVIGNLGELVGGYPADMMVDQIVELYRQSKE